MKIITLCDSQMDEEYLSEASSETSELTIPTATTPEPERGTRTCYPVITLINPTGILFCLFIIKCYT